MSNLRFDQLHAELMTKYKKDTHQCYMDGVGESENKIQTLEKTIAILGKSNGFYAKDHAWLSSIGKGLFHTIDDADIFPHKGGAYGGKTARSANREVKELLGEREFERIINDL